MNKRDYNNISNIYESVILEIRESELEDVNHARLISELPFNDLFNGKYRLVVPINTDDTFNEILNKITEFPDISFDRFDFDKKKALVTIQTQQGPKTREESLASLVAKMSKANFIDDTEKTKYIKWIEQNTKEMKKPEYSLVFSRSPVDVVRMSDIGDIQSCHSPSGGYFKCAKDEARSGGVVVYVVNNSELDKVDTNSMENELEIFTDEDRDFKGITAYARLRLRKYMDKRNDSMFLLPDERIYLSRGSTEFATNVGKIPGVHDTVKAVLKNKQKTLDKDQLLKDYKKREITLMGGSYTDTSNSNLFNFYFDTDEFRGDINHEDENSEDRSDTLEHELRQYQTQIRNAEHISASYDIDDMEDEPYYSVSGGIAIDVTGFDISDDFIDLNIGDLDSAEIQRFVQGPSKYNKRELDSDILSFIQSFVKNTKSTNIDGYSIGYISYYTHNSKDIIYIGCVFEDDGISSNADDYDTYLGNLLRWENDYDDIKKAVLKTLFQSGYLELDNKQKLEWGIGYSAKNPQGYDNFKYEEEDGNWTIEVPTGVLNTYIYTIPSERKLMVEDDIRDLFNHHLYKFLLKQPEFASNDKELQKENYQVETRFDIDDETIYTHIHVYGKAGMLSNYGAGSGIGEIVAKITFIAPEHYIKYMNKYIDDIRNICTLIVAKVFVPEEKFNQSHHFTNLQRYY